MQLCTWTRGLMVAGVVLLSTQLAAHTPAARFMGKPTFKEGKALGYFVWKDGDTWRVRWTTFGANHRFSGRVTLDGGDIKSFKRIDVDTERKVIAPGRPGRNVRGPRGRAVGVAGGRPPVVAERDEDHIQQETEKAIRFLTRTDDDIDGFDFKVSDSTTHIRFVLEIDGEPRPAEIEVGKENFKPNEVPVVAELK